MTKRKILAALREGAFTPGKKGPMQIIADVGNTEYYLRRASEFLTLSLTALTSAQQIHYLNSTLSLVALAKVKINESAEKA